MEVTGRLWQLAVTAVAAAVVGSACSGPASTQVTSDNAACTSAAITRALAAHSGVTAAGWKLQAFDCKDGWAIASVVAPSLHPALYAILRRTSSGWRSERAVDAACFPPGSCPGYMLPPPAVLGPLVRKIGPLVSGAA